MGPIESWDCLSLKFSKIDFTLLKCQNLPKNHPKTPKNQVFALTQSISIAQWVSKACN
jgi:hypothetical protein